ncbi:MAG: hypothetical protein U0V74_11660 [Chitinophagales bacterium]
MRNHILFLLAALMLLSACTRNNNEAKRDKEYEKYLEYKDIFNAYGTVPADTTRLKLEDFLKHFPENAQAWVFYARVMYDANQLPQSMEAYRKAIASNPRYSAGYSGLGTLHRIMGNTDSAQYYLQQALALKDSSAFTYVNLSAVYLVQNKTPLSLTYADTALQLADSNAAILSGLSFIYAKAGKPLTSDSLFRTALAMGLRDSAGFCKVLNGEMKLEDYYRINKY